MSVFRSGVMRGAYMACIAVLAQLVVPVSVHAQSAPPADEPVVLRPGDMIRIEVWRRAELSGEFRVAADGSIVHPLFRQIRVDATPVEEVQGQLQRFLEQFEANPSFVVEFLFRVRVGGEVRQPGMYSLPAGTTIEQAIWGAGGVADRGRLDRVRLVRHGQERVLDFTDPNGNDLGVPLRSGDEVLVGRRTAIFRDYVVPVASVTTALYSILRLVRIVDRW